MQNSTRICGKHAFIEKIFKIKLLLIYSNVHETLVCSEIFDFLTTYKDLFQYKAVPNT